MHIILIQEKTTIGICQIQLAKDFFIPVTAFRPAVAMAESAAKICSSQFDLELPLASEEQTLEYAPRDRQIGGRTWEFEEEKLL